ncbi:prepilin-type N-terminal cleavage/methylation domain-containing protein [Geopseudomonas aromaticivorans]
MQKQKGFTLIELVVVIVILGVLAAVALPRFMNATEDAHSAAVSGTGGALAAGVALVRSQWELNRAKGVATPHTNVAGFGNGLVDVDSTNGWPVGTSTSGSADACVEVWENVMQGSAPSVVASTATTTTGFDYIASGTTTCTYTYKLDGRTSNPRTISYDTTSGVVITDAE